MDSSQSGGLFWSKFIVGGVWTIPEGTILNGTDQLVESEGRMKCSLCVNIQHRFHVMMSNANCSQKLFDSCLKVINDKCIHGFISEWTIAPLTQHPRSPPWQITIEDCAALRRGFQLSSPPWSKRMKAGGSNGSGCDALPKAHCSGQKALLQCVMFGAAVLSGTEALMLLVYNVSNV